MLWQAMASLQHIFSLCCHALFFWYCSLLWDLPAVYKPHNLFEFSLDSTEKTSPVLTVENGRCFMDLLCVFRCSFQKHFKNGESGQMVIFVLQRFDINCHLLWKPLQFFSHSFQAGRATIGRCILLLCAH